MGDIIFLETTDSTNEYLKRLAKKGAPEGTAVAANEQTAGKGRMGRSFFSPKNTGVYLSILLRPRKKAEEIRLITPMAAVAVAGSIERSTPAKAKIKWVNDIYVDSKKVCGILTEASFSGEYADYVIVGIGVNIFEPEGGFPADIKKKAGAILYKRADEKVKKAFCEDIVDSFLRLYRENDRNFINEYKKRSFITGMDITVTDGGVSYPARVIGTDDECRLIVEKENGEIKRLFSGEVSIRI